ncbi:MAG: hypothetical protein R3E01_14255 [Pirellulaceae bacterium]|nr:hypothetical protein [Planctomycetales bacterium]
MSYDYQGHEYYELMRRENQRLTHVLHAVGDMLRGERGDVERLVYDLGQLVELLDSHFDHEEQSDFVTNVRRRAPHLLQTAQEAIAQHADISDQAKKILILARNGVVSDAWWRQLSLRFDEFAREFLAHEAHEYELLQSAYGQDIGAAD